MKCKLGTDPIYDAPVSLTSTTDPGWLCRTCGRPFEGEPGALCPHDGAVLVPTVVAARFSDDTVLGRVLGHDLRVFDVLSDSGGFGRVYRAFQPALAREVVVKVLRPEAAARPEARARLFREARALARLSHAQSVVTVHDCVEIDGQVCLVMERAPGQPLSRVLDDGPLPAARAQAILHAILGALDAAHAVGLVHRDLKPDNVLVEGDAVTLIDFGIAKDLAPEADDVRTASGVHLGTPRYMAPEQLQRDGAIGPATDVYAAGVLFYEMITGQTPFLGNAAELVAAHLYKAPPRVGVAAVDALIQKAMRKPPEDRFASAAAMQRALGAPAPEARDPTRTGTVDAGSLPLVLDAPNPLWKVLAGSLAALALGVLVGALAFDDPAPTPVAVADAVVTPAVVPDTAIVQAIDASVDVALALAHDAAKDAQQVAAAPPKPRPARRPRPKARPRAKPEDVQSLRGALKVCRCDQARKILTRLKGTTDEKRWRAAVSACKPKLIGQACAFSEP